MVHADAKIFISHNSIDKNVADMLLEFLVLCGIPREQIFCSSLPGNDVRQKISEEVKEALKISCLNIAILSRDYYESSYCLNEAGVFWFREVPFIPIALPEIHPKDMTGFLNDNYKIRRLDCETDIAYILDCANKCLGLIDTPTTVYAPQKEKLTERYDQHLATRSFEETESEASAADIDFIDMTDDEKVALSFVYSTETRKIDKESMKMYLQNQEVCGIDIDNAFDLLEASGYGIQSANIFEVNLEVFRKITLDTEELPEQLKQSIIQHRKLGVDQLDLMWDTTSVDENIVLFLGYIFDEKVITLGARWMAEGQIKHIKMWEEKNGLDHTLSDHYSDCLSFFVEHNLVYENDWTSHGNPREYRLCLSMENLISESPDYHAADIRIAKELHLRA